NWAFRRGIGLYTGIVGLALRGSAVVLLLYGGLVLLTWWTSTQLPTGYIPNQDQGRFYIAVQLPDATSMERTQRALDHIRLIMQPDDEKPMAGVVHTTEIAGMSFTFNANGSNFGQFFCTLDEFDKRRSADLTSTEIVKKVNRLLRQEVPEASASLFTPPPVPGLGSASGFKI